MSKNIHGDVPSDIDDPDYKPPAILPGDDPPYHFEDQPESRPDYKPPTQEDLEFVVDAGDRYSISRGVTLPEEERLTWAIQGQAVMVTSIPEPRRDGSYRIVLSSSENWVLKSVLMSGLDSLTEIEVILAPKI